jgi:hypothetical protein
MESILISLEGEAMKDAGKELHELIISNQTGDCSVVNIVVSFNETSLTGVVFVISVYTEMFWAIIVYL